MMRIRTKKSHCRVDYRYAALRPIGLVAGDDGGEGGGGMGAGGGALDNGKATMAIYFFIA